MSRDRKRSRLATAPVLDSTARVRLTPYFELLIIFHTFLEKKRLPIPKGLIDEKKLIKVLEDAAENADNKITAMSSED